MHTKSFSEKYKHPNTDTLFEKFAHFPVSMNNGRIVWLEKYLEFNLHLVKAKYLEKDVFIEKDNKLICKFGDYTIKRLKGKKK